MDYHDWWITMIGLPFTITIDGLVDYHKDYHKDYHWWITIYHVSANEFEADLDLDLKGQIPSIQAAHFLDRESPVVSAVMGVSYQKLWDHFLGPKMMKYLQIRNMVSWGVCFISDDMCGIRY